MKRSSTQQSTQTALSNVSKRSRATSRSKRSTLKKNAQIVRFPSFGFPTKLQVKHKYVDSNGLNGALGALAVQQFRANGMYDPDYTSTGHQPMYFDQLAAVYDHFTVLKSYLKLTVHTLSGTSGQLVSVYLNDDTTVTPGTKEARIEQSSAKDVTLTAYGGPQTIYLGFDAYKTFGGSILGNDNLQGSASADPTEQTLFTITAAAIDPSQTTSVWYTAEIVYTAVWDELKDITSS